MLGSMIVYRPLVQAYVVCTQAVIQYCQRVERGRISTRRRTGFGATWNNEGSMPEVRFLAMIEELASDHAAYARVDLTNQVKILHDTIEDMMMRLEEFESIFGMVQTEGAECLSGQIPRLQTARRGLTGLCRRIDALEHVVARANVNLVSLEAAVDAAEADLGVPDSLFSKLNPLSFFKKAQEPVACTRIPTFDPPMIYKTEQFFNPE